MGRNILSSNVNSVVQLPSGSVGEQLISVNLAMLDNVRETMYLSFRRKNYLSVVELQPVL
jgi:hypothetical protein